MSQCNNQRPCAACIAAGTQCQDWRPGMELVVSLPPISQASLEHLSYELAAPPLSLNEADTNVAGPKSLAWPSAPSADRHRRPAYPYDSLITDEKGVTEHIGASGGVAHLAYLANTRSDVFESPDDMTGRNITWPIAPVQYENAHAAALGVQSPYDLIESEQGWKVVSPISLSPLDGYPWLTWIGHHACPAIPRYDTCTLADFPLA